MKYADAAADYLVKLQAATADRPAHAKYLTDLMAAMNAGKDLVDVPVQPGVSSRVVDALLDDMFWIESARGVEDSSKGMSVYPHAYRDRRHTDARAASQRQRTQDSLQHLLRFEGDTR